MVNVKRISIVALILLVIGIVGSLLTFRSVVQFDEVSEEKVINEAFTQMEIITDNTEVRVLPSSESSAKVEMSGKSRKNSRYDLSTNVEGEKLTILVEHKQQSFINFFPSSLSMTLYIPEKEYESLIVESDNGRIHLDTLQADNINLKTDNGRIELRNIEGNAISTQSANGSIDLVNVIASLVSVKSNNGKITLDDVEGELSGKTDNGRITLITDDLDRFIELETDNGRINIQTEAEPTNATIAVSVDNGKVDVFGSSVNHTVIGNGDNLIKLTTSNGRVTLEKR